MPWFGRKKLPKPEIQIKEIVVTDGLMSLDGEGYQQDIEYVKRLLEATGRSKAHCARLMGLHPRSMQHYLTGRHKVPYLVVFALEWMVVQAKGRAAFDVFYGPKAVTEPAKPDPAPPHSDLA